MKTIKAFVEQSHIEASLIRAVIRQVGSFDSFKEIAQDVCNHGANSGWAGFTYYKDTVAFTKRNRKAIVSFLEEQAKECDEPTLNFLSQFNCLQGEDKKAFAKAFYSGKGESASTVYNALAWFALEEVCRSYCDIKEQE